MHQQEIRNFKKYLKKVFKVFVRFSSSEWQIVIESKFTNWIYLW